MHFCCFEIFKGLHLSFMLYHAGNIYLLRRPYTISPNRKTKNHHDRALLHVSCTLSPTMITWSILCVSLQEFGSSHPWGGHRRHSPLLETKQWMIMNIFFIFYPAISLIPFMSSPAVKAKIVANEVGGGGGFPYNNFCKFQVSFFSIWALKHFYV